MRPHRSVLARIITAVVVGTSLLVVPIALLHLPFGPDIGPAEVHAAGTTLGQHPAPPNHNFEAGPYTFMPKMHNWRLNDPSSDFGSVPNHDFESSLSNWTTTGTVTTTATACYSGTCVVANNSASLTSSTVEIHADAQFITFQYTNTASFILYLYDDQDTLLKSKGFTSPKSSWTEGKIVVEDYVGQPVKVKFAVGGGAGGKLFLDNAGAIVELFPGWTIVVCGVCNPLEPEKLVRASGPPVDYYAQINAGVDMLSAPITVSEYAQYMLIDVYLPVGGTLVWHLLTGPTYSTTSASGTVAESSASYDVGWNNDVRIPLRLVRGMSTRLRVSRNANYAGFDNAWRFHDEIPMWKLTRPEYYQVGHEAEVPAYLATLNTSQTAESTSFNVPPDETRLSFLLRHPGTFRSTTVYVLEGPSFDSPILEFTKYARMDEWTEYAIDLTDYRDKEIRLRFVSSSGVHLGSVGYNLWDRYFNPCDEQVGDPCSTSTGLFTLSRSEWEIPAVGPDLDLQRHYSAQSSYTGTMGSRWMHNWDWLLKVEADNDVVIRYGRGSTHTFDESAGSYTSEDGIFDVLAKIGSDYYLTLIDQTELKFNASGRLLQVADRTANTASLAYDGSGRLATVTADDGRAITFTYESGRLTEVEDPIGRVVGFAYTEIDDVWHLTTVTDTVGGTWTYAYADYKVVSEQDPRGYYSFINVYDGGNRIEAQTDAEGGVLYLNYKWPAEGYTTVTGTRGYATRYEFDSHFHTLGRTIDPGGADVWMKFEYDGVGNRAYITRSAAMSTYVEYDASGNIEYGRDTVGRESHFGYTSANDVSTGTLPAGRTVANDYDANGNLITATLTVTHPSYSQVQELVTLYDRNPDGTVRALTDPRGSVTEYVYDELGYVRVITHHLDAGAVVTRAFEYNDIGWMTKKWDGLGHLTTYHYDDAGRVITTTDALGHSVVNVYDGIGNLRRVTDELGRDALYDYDGLSRLISSTNTAGHTVEYEYDAEGNRTRVSQVVSGVVVSETYSYDPAGRLTASTDAEGGVTTYLYDNAGRLVGSVDAETGLTTTTSFDDADRVIEVTDPLGNDTVVAYDTADHPTSITDAEDNLTLYDYDPLGRLLAVVDAEGYTTTYSYDEAGNRTSLTDANGHVREFKYDALDRQTEIRLYESPTQTHSTILDFDANGAVITRTDALSQVTRYDYDAVGRLRHASYPSTTDNVTFTYTANGSRRTMTDPTGTWRYDYDDAYRVENVVYTRTASTPITVTYEYDEAGNRGRIVYPDDDDVVYAYDRASQLETVTDWVGNETQYAYDRSGRLRQTVLENGATSTLGYDDAGRLITVTHAVTSSEIAQFTYVLDAVGNRKQVSAREGVYSYTYDDDYRLTHVAYPAGGPSLESQYVYDPVGNRALMVITDTSGSATTTYEYDDLDRLLSVASGGGQPETLSWSELGELTGQGNDTFEYDVESGLTEAVVGGSTNRYEYNGDGVRMAKSVDQNQTEYTVDVQAELPVVLGDSTYKYVYGLDLIAAVDSSDDALYHLTDGLGSTVSVVDDEGVERQYTTYDAFGDVRTQLGGEIDEFLFAGEQFDSETGLIFLRARYYDPATGRLLSRDPQPGVGSMPATLNPYAYVNNNPANLTDPSGETWWDLLFSAGDGVAWIDAELDPCSSSVALAAARFEFAVGIVGPGSGKMSVKALIEIADRVGQGNRMREWLARVYGRMGASPEDVNVFLRANAARGSYSLVTHLPDAGKKFNQLAQRGWSRDSINQIVNSPFAMRAATNRATGAPATAYFRSDGHYVVRDNLTGNLVQMSDTRLRIGTGAGQWIPDSSIVDPIIP